MAPILIKDNGEAMPESTDIVRYVDNTDSKPVLTGSTNPAIAEWLQRVGSYSAKLLLPRIAHADFEEFATDSARRYFIDKSRRRSVILPTISPTVPIDRRTGSRPANAITADRLRRSGKRRAVRGRYSPVPDVTLVVDRRRSCAAGQRGSLPQPHGAAQRGAVAAGYGTITFENDK